MPAPIHIPQRVVVDIRIPVEALRVPRLRHQHVRLQEAAQGRIVEALFVIIQAQASLPPLPGVAAVGGEKAGLEPESPKDEITLLYNMLRVFFSQQTTSCLGFHD